MKTDTSCRHCGKIVTQQAGGRLKRYCDPGCKQKHYRARRKADAVEADAADLADLIAEADAAVLDPEPEPETQDEPETIFEATPRPTPRPTPKPASRPIWRPRGRVRSAW